MLLPMLDTPRIQAVCEYSESAETAEWTFSYGGPRLDIPAAGDDLAISLLKGITEEIEYGRNENDELPNRLRLKIHP